MDRPRSAIGRQLLGDPGTTGVPQVRLTVVGVVRHIRHRDITRDLLREASRLALFGILAGSAGAYVAASMLKGVLHNISPHDPFTYAAALAVVAGAVLISSWSPARRAAGTAPADALKGP